MRILLTNNTLSLHAGTEMVVRDLALELRDRGHAPMCFSLDLGALADSLRAAGIPVTDDLARLPAAPDLIHGHHLIETTLAAMYFPRVPVISFCHGSVPWQEAPCRLPNVVRWVAVDRATRRRLVETEGVEAARIGQLLNFVDTRRFQPRPPLPPRPLRALIFSNTAKESTHIPPIREACEAAGIRLDVAGAGSGNLTTEPEQILPQYDLVFAKAKAAIEAMAVGCAVIQADFFGAGHLITTGRFDDLRAMNFGFESMNQPLTVEHLLAQIACYDPADAAKVRDRIRDEASLEQAASRLFEIYESAAAQPVPEFSPVNQAQDFLRVIAVLAKRQFGETTRGSGRVLCLPLPLRGGEPVARQIDAALSGHETQKDRAERLRREGFALRDRLAAAKEQLAAARNQHAAKPRGALRRWWERWTGTRQ